MPTHTYLVRSSLAGLLVALSIFTAGCQNLLPRTAQRDPTAEKQTAEKKTAATDDDKQPASDKKPAEKQQADKSEAAKRDKESPAEPVKNATENQLPAPTIASANRVFADEHWSESTWGQKQKTSHRRVDASGVSTIRSPMEPSTEKTQPAHWRHLTIESLLDQEPQSRLLLEKLAKSPQPTIAAQAAIYLVRHEHLEPIEQLQRVVRNDQMTLVVRRATIETLGQIGSPAARQSVEELLRHHGAFTGEARRTYLPELHADLLRARAAQGVAADDKFLMAALDSPAAVVRRAALEAMAASHPTKVSPRVMQLTDDSDPQVRLAGLKLLIVAGDSMAEQRLIKSTYDVDLANRTSAIEILGSCKTETARQRLRALSADRAELIRVAAVGALIASGDSEIIDTAAIDKSWRVRCVVAEALADRPNRKSAFQIESYFKDSSPAVQQCAIDSLESWPVEQAVPLLLTALESGGYLPRKSAATQLAVRWPEGGSFPADATAKDRAERLTQMRAKWSGRAVPSAKGALAKEAPDSGPHTISPETVERVTTILRQDFTANSDAAATKLALSALGELGDQLLPALEAASAKNSVQVPDVVLMRLLADHDPAFAAVVDIIQGNTQLRRKALGVLLRQAATKPVSPVVIDRLAQLARDDQDTLLWTGLMTLVQDDRREPAVALAGMAMSHDDGEVRRRACQYFMLNPRAENESLLLPALDDLQPAVVIAAARALGELPSLRDAAALSRHLIHPDRQVRVEIARSLAKQRDPAGAAALERLANDSDERVRRKAISAMGELADPIFVPLLMAALNDKTDVRYAALAALEGTQGGLPNEKGFIETDQGVVQASFETAENGKSSTAKKGAATSQKPMTSTVTTTLSADEKQRRWLAWYRRQQGSTEGKQP